MSVTEVVWIAVGATWLALACVVLQHALRRVRTRPLRAAATAACALPLAALLSFGTLVLRARLESGVWPRHELSFEEVDGVMTVVLHSAPAGDFGLHYLLASLTYLAALGSVVVVLPLAVALVLERRLSGRALGAYALAYAGLAWVAWSDPGGVWDWFLD